MNNKITVTVYKDGINEETFVQNENGDIMLFCGCEFENGGIEDEASKFVIGSLKFLGFDVFEVHKTGSAPMELLHKAKHYWDYVEWKIKI